MQLKNLKNYGKRGALALGTFLAAGSAFAQTATTAKDQVISAVTGGGADAREVAVAVVVVLWGITAIYLMRRKG